MLTGMLTARLAFRTCDAVIVELVRGLRSGVQQVPAMPRASSAQADAVQYATVYVVQPSDRIKNLLQADIFRASHSPIMMHLQSQTVRTSFRAKPVVLSYHCRTALRTTYEHLRFCSPLLVLRRPRKLTPVQDLERLLARLEKRTEALHHVKLDGFEMVVSELEVEQDYLRQASATWKISVVNHVPTLDVSNRNNAASLPSEFRNAKCSPCTSTLAATST